MRRTRPAAPRTGHLRPRPRRLRGALGPARADRPPPLRPAGPPWHRPGRGALRGLWRRLARRAAGCCAGGRVAGATGALRRGRPVRRQRDRLRCRDGRPRDGTPRRGGARRDLRRGSRSAGFDVITFVHSMYYVPDVAATLRAAHDLLRPGGELLVLSAPRGALNELVDVLAPPVDGHRQWFSDDVAAGVADAGLRSERDGHPGRSPDLAAASDEVLDFTVQARLTPSCDRWCAPTSTRCRSIAPRPAFCTYPTPWTSTACVGLLDQGGRPPSGCCELIMTASLGGKGHRGGIRRWSCGRSSSSAGQCRRIRTTSDAPWRWTRRCWCIPAAARTASVRTATDVRGSMSGKDEADLPLVTARSVAG